MDRRGGNPFRGQPLSGQYDWGYREYDADAGRRYYGVPFREPVAFRVDPDRLALACLAADRQGALVPCCRLLQRLIFVDGVVIDDGVDGGSRRPAGASMKLLSGATSPPRATRTRHDALLDGGRRTRRLRRADLLPGRADVLGQRSPGAARGSPRQSRLVSLLYRTTSNRPAAPMPPPMHIVTTTFLALRRRPRSGRGRAARAGHAEGMANRDRAGH